MPNSPSARWKATLSSWLVVLLLVFRGLAEGQETSPHGGVVDKHATELDLECQGYNDGVDWLDIKAKLRSFLSDPRLDHVLLVELLELARRKPKSDCYIGLCSLGYLGLLVFDTQRRITTLKDTMFGGISLLEQIPLSYWDTIASGWPIFSLLDLLALSFKDDEQTRAAVQADKTECCDRLGELSGSGTRESVEELNFLNKLKLHLSEGSLIPVTESLQYLSKAPAHCSWGKASAYFALAEGLLRAPSAQRLHRAARDMMQLGESQLELCASGRTVTVGEHAFSAWPFWAILRRIESHPDSFKALRAQGPPGPARVASLPPGYQAPPPMSPKAGVVRQTARFSSDRSVAARRPSEMERAATCDKRDVHVALAGDRRHAEGLLAALHSVVIGTAEPWRVCIHIFCTANEAGLYKAALRCSFNEQLHDGLPCGGMELAGVSLQLHVFDPADVLDTSGFPPVNKEMLAESGDLSAPHNFVRFNLSRWIPTSVARKLVYLDTDIVVVGDIAELHDEALADPSAVVAAVPRPHLPISVYLKALSPRFPSWLPSAAPSFNAGVMVINMPAWEAADIPNRVQQLFRQNRERALWRHGSQPPLLLLLYDKVEWLDGSWNVDGLGHRTDIPASTLQSARILHWTGPCKPWIKNGLNKEIWQRFSVHCWGTHMEEQI